MQVVKRDGRREDVAFEKVQQRIHKQAEGLSVNVVKVAQGVLTRLVDGITTTELDNIASNLAYSWSTTHPDYAVLAGRIALSNHQKNTPSRFVDVIERLDAVRDRAGNPASMLDPEFVRVVRENADRIESRIVYDRDFNLDYFGFKTLEKAYLLRDTDRRIVERPQHLWMRVAIGLWTHDLDKAFETYDMMSQKLYTHATPTLFNAGTKRPQLSSCFVAGTQVHTMNGVKNIEDVAIGDEVVTHLGNVKKVVQLHRNPIGDRHVYDIKIAGSPSISVTDNHRLWSISDEQERWGETPKWNSVGYLRTGDWVALPKKTGGSPFTLDVKTVLDNLTSDGNNINYRFEYSDTQVFPCAVWKRTLASGEECEWTKPSKPFNRYWTFDDNMMELMGIWYGDGCVVHEKNSAREMKPRSINIVSYHNNTELIDFVSKTFVEKLGIEHLTVSKDKHNMVSMTVNNQYIAYVFKHVFKCFDGKRLPAFFNTLGYSQVLSFLSGLISSDGCVSKEQSITVCLTNPPLVTDIYHLARSVGIPVTMTMMHNYDRKPLKPTGRLGMPCRLFVDKIKKYYSDDRLSYLSKESPWSNIRIIDGVTFMRLNGKAPSDSRPEVVYTLGVEDDHSYSVGGIVAENCFLLAMNDDSIKGIYKTLEDCALISQYGGGIGVHCSNIRAKGSLIRGTGGISNGLVPMLRVFNNTARYVDQCFHPDTLVYTEAGPKRIADVATEDKVLTSGASEIVDVDGKHGFLDKGPTYHTVMKRVEHDYDGEILHVAVSINSITSNISVTASHPVFAVQKAAGSSLDPAYALEQGLANLDYIEIGKLSPGDYVAFPALDSPSGKYKGFNFSTIKSMSTAGYKGKLYDLEVDGTHDYLVYGLGIAHNGGGKRNGSFAMYLEPWHADISEFLELKKNTGAEEERARDLFYALWIPDLFMERVDANGDWTLFCPNEAPGLADVVGDEFKALYEKYEAEGRGRRTIKAQKLWFQILDSQIETGTPYLCYKDAANKKSNQQNLGVIKSSNLCSEVIEYSSSSETAVCNLGSMSLPAFVRDGAFDFKHFRDTVRVAVRNLNRVIDINYYPTPEARRSNMRHRPIGLGVQGLADVFAMLKMPWESEEAAALNRRIFAHMYYAALDSSCTLAATEGTYETYVGSPAWKGKFQPHLWNIDPLQDEGLDWDTLFHNISRIGLRNSLLVSPMPTASTSQILGNCECIEPYATHIFTRRTLAGEFIIINKHLVAALIERGIWSPEVKDAIIGNNGSVAGLPMIPADLQAIYKTVWEIKQKTLIDMAADRGPYVCQSQSLNLFMGDPDYRKLTSMHFYTWRKGLKTGIYYLRTRAVASAQKFTVEPVRVISAVPEVKEEEGCLMCSS